MIKSLLSPALMAAGVSCVSGMFALPCLCFVPLASLDDIKRRIKNKT